MLQVDRSPCGSGTCARVALQRLRGVLSLGQKRRFRSGVTGSEFTASAVREVPVKRAGLRSDDVTGVVTEVSGRAHYAGTSTFSVEADDPFMAGFLPHKRGKQDKAPSL